MARNIPKWFTPKVELEFRRRRLTRKEFVELISDAADLPFDPKNDDVVFHAYKLDGANLAVERLCQRLKWLGPFAVDVGPDDVAK